VFDDYYSNFLAPHEGGYTANDGNGKPANFGINQAANPDIDVSKLTPDQAKALTYSRYWRASGADYMNPALAAVQADTAFNMGPNAAFQLLQASGGDPQKYLQLRAQKYQAIAQADPTKAASLPRWMKRNSDLANYVSGFSPHPDNPQPPQQQANGPQGQPEQTAQPAPGPSGPTGQPDQVAPGPEAMTGIGPSIAMRMLFGGKDRYQTMRNGWAYDTWTNQWQHFPDLGTGVTGKMGPDGNVQATVADGEPKALATVTAAQAVPRAMANAQGRMAADENENYIDTGGAGVGLQGGGIRTPPGPIPPGAGLPPASAQPAQGRTAQPTKTVQGTMLPPVSEAAPINPSADYLKERQPQWAKAEDDMYDALPSGVVAEQRALAIADSFKATASGQWAEEKASVAAKLKALGPAGQWFANQPWFGDPAKVQEALKNNFASTLNQIRAFSSRPAAIELTQAQKNFASPGLQPEANLQIIGETVGTLRWERAMANDWGAAKAQGWQDPQDFQRAWMQHNPIQGFIDKAENDIGPLKGMNSASAATAVHAPSGRAMPSVGQVVRGYRFKGGDPSSQSSWQRAN
jgi:hypothetical protein